MTIERSRQTGLRRAAFLLTVAVVVFALYVRFVDLRDVFCRSPDELAEIMPGVRLHALPMTNLGAPVRYNFIQSMFYSQHGLGDVSFYYLASGVLSLVRLPVSERWLFAASGTTNLALAVAGVVFAASLLESAATGWVFALLVLASPFYVFVSRTGWGRLTWTPLLLIVLMLVQDRALKRRGAAWPLAFWTLAGFTALTDACIMLPIVPVAALVRTRGRLTERLRQLSTDRVFIAGLLAMAAGILVDLAIGLAARRRGTDLTMVGYLLLRGGLGTVWPTVSAFTAWTASVDAYFPFRGAWLLVAVAFVLAVRQAWRGEPIGIVAAWWALASFGVFRYTVAMQVVDSTAVPGWLNTYYLAPPSLLLVAWLITRIAAGPAARASRARRIGAGALVAGLVIPMALQASVVAFSDSRAYGLRADQLTRQTEVPMSVCRTIKAAAFYIRSHQPGLPYVFHLSSDGANVYLGHIAEFYDGLSYGRSSNPEEPNRLLDFGIHHYGRNLPPEAFYRPYGVTRFDYYIDFLTDRDRAGFKPPVIARLLNEGARVVCTIWYEGRPIGRVISFHPEPAVDLDYRVAAASWDHTFARARTLLQQPIAGTAYHFGYNWRPPE